MRTTLYIASAAPLADAARFERLLGAVPAARRDRLAPIKNETVRRLSLAASGLLVRALRDAGLHAEELAVGEYGKPCFPALPDFHFNLSHSGDTALCAVSAEDVGCDIELPGRYDPRLARRFFHPAECEWLFARPGQEQGDAFLRLWTCKESFIKAVGLGLSLPLDSFCVIPGERASLRQTFDARPWRLRSFRDGERFLALCGLAGVEDAPLVRVDFGEEYP